MAEYTPAMAVGIAGALLRLYGSAVAAVEHTASPRVIAAIWLISE